MDRRPDANARQAARQVFQRLDALDPATVGAEQEDGDRTVLDRWLPALKPVDSPAPLPAAVDAGDLAGAPSAVLKALFAGALSPDQAGTIATVLSALARVREATKFEERLIAPEKANAARQP